MRKTMNANVSKVCYGQTILQFLTQGKIKSFWFVAFCVGRIFDWSAGALFCAAASLIFFDLAQKFNAPETQDSGGLVVVDQKSLDRL